MNTRFNRSNLPEYLSKEPPIILAALEVARRYLDDKNNYVVSELLATYAIQDDRKSVKPDAPEFP
jgi:hypothetical protein